MLAMHLVATVGAGREAVPGRTQAPNTPTLREGMQPMQRGSPCMAVQAFTMPSWAGMVPTAQLRMGKQLLQGKPCKAPRMHKVWDGLGPLLKAQGRGQAAVQAAGGAVAGVA